MDARKSHHPIEQLGYAPPAPWYCRSRFLMRIVVVMFVIVGAVILWKRGPAIDARMRLNRLQSRCMEFDWRNGWGSTKGKPSAPIPQWTQFYLAMSGTAQKSDGMLFLGTMRSPSGNERLVAVDCCWSASSSRPSVLLRAHVCIPGSMLRNPRWAGKNTSSDGAIPIDSPSLKFAALDPLARDHLIIKTGGDVIIDGWLQDNDDLIFELRSDPTPPPPATSAPSP